MCAFSDAAAQRGLYYQTVCKAMACDSCLRRLAGGCLRARCRQQAHARREEVAMPRYTKGDYVVHPGQGVCEVDRIVEL